MRRTRPLVGLPLVMALAVLSSCSQATESENEIASVSRAPNADGTSSRPDSQAVLDDYLDDMERVVTCLRRNGLPQVPDPGPLGEVRLDTRELDDPQALARARTACQHVQVPMPPEVRALVQEQEAEEVTDEDRRVFAEYARCMQENGASDFPDPLPRGLPDEKAWDQTSSGAQRALAACAHLVGGTSETGPGVG